MAGLVWIATTGKPSVADEPVAMSTRVYPIADLLDLPLVDDDVRTSATMPPANLGGGMGGGGMGGGGMGGGGGMFYVPDNALGQLAGGSGMGGGGIETPYSGLDGTRIADVLSYHTRAQNILWEDYDGEGGCISVLGTSLWITQTASGHDAVAGLLKMLREATGDRSTIQVDVRMIEIESDAAIQIHDASAEMLEQLAMSKEAMMLSLRCENYHSAKVSAGLRRTYVVSVMPVVGGDGLEVGSRSVGYRPVTESHLLGIFGNVRPMIESGKSSGRIQMSIGLSSGPEEVAQANFSDDVTIDRVEIESTELNVTVTTAPNQWTIAGVSTVTNPTSSLTAGQALPHMLTVVRWTKPE